VNQWTDSPQADGYYWLWDEGKKEEGDLLHVVEVFTFRGKQRLAMCGEYWGDALPIQLNGGKWLRIQEPEVPRNI